MRLTRKQKLLRNLLLCLLLGLAVYAMLGFPPYTVRGMLEDVERRYLLSDLELVRVERDQIKYSNELFPWHTTYLMARTGDTWLWTSFSRHLLEVRPDYRGGFKMERGGLCAAHDGTLYIGGDFGDAASAQVEVTVEKITQVLDPDTGDCEITVQEGRTFAYEGERAGDDLFTCRYREGEWQVWRHMFDRIPEEEYGLEEAAESWYRCYIRGGGSGSSWIHADLPVKVTLYDGSGAVLEVLELSIDTYELGRVI